jgi:hypothetical protein
MAVLAERATTIPTCTGILLDGASFKSRLGSLGELFNVWFIGLLGGGVSLADKFDEFPPENNGPE